MSPVLMPLFILGVIPIICFLYWVYFRPTSLWTAFFFLYLVSGILLIIVTQIEKINNQLAWWIAVIIGMVILLVGVFGLLATVIGLFINQYYLIKREGKSLSNLLPLIVGIGIVGMQGLFLLASLIKGKWYLTTLSSFFSSIFTYIGVVFVFYTITAFLYNHYPIRKKVDYIIVLGAGLINGEKVTPLLASRINIAMSLYQKQQKKYQHNPTVILSGGQGPDEKISEAEAMKQYMVEQGFNVDKLYLETESTNTKENMRFSENMAIRLDNISDFRQKNVVIASNNYHILRAGKLAAQLGIPARGIGSKTKLYYLPTAFIREFIGYLFMTKRTHLFVVGIFAGIGLVSVLLEWFIS